jgi:hypothetical protein
VCTAPCSERIPAGKYPFKVRREGTFVASTSLDVDADTRLKETLAHYDEQTLRNPMRGFWLTMGGIMFGVGGVGVGLFAYGFNKDLGFTLAGLNMAVVGLGSGLCYVLLGSLSGSTKVKAHDEFHLEKVAVTVGPTEMAIVGAF